MKNLEITKIKFLKNTEKILLGAAPCRTPKNSSLKNALNCLQVSKILASKLYQVMTLSKVRQGAASLRLSRVSASKYLKINLARCGRVPHSLNIYGCSNETDLSFRGAAGCRTHKDLMFYGLFVTLSFVIKFNVINVLGGIYV